jgi:hypothetical protein
MTTVRPSTLEWPPEWSIHTVGMSQSLWREWFHCQRSFLFVLNGYSLPSKEEKTNFGSICHNVIDKVYTKGRYPSSDEVNRYIDEYCDKRLQEGAIITQNRIEQDSTKAEATLVKYFEYYKEDFETKRFQNIEHVFRTRYSGCVQKGKIDGGYITHGKKWLMEHKSKGIIIEDALMLYLNLDFQNLFYLLNDELETGELATGMLYNVIRNSQIKLLKNQSLHDFKKNIMRAITTDPKHHFKRWEVTYTKEDHDMFRKNLTLQIEHLKNRTDMPIYPSTCHCLNPWQCQFLTACSSDSMRSLVKSEESIDDRIFSELKENKNGSKKIERKIAKRKKIAERVKKS